MKIRILPNAKQLLYVCLIGLFTLITATTRAQQHQWIRGGGSIFAQQFGGADEFVSDMTVDEHGNLYVLAEVMGFGSITISGMTFPIRNTNGNPGDAKTALLSYTCDGQIRWGKIIEGQQKGSFHGLTYDHNGGVYIAGSQYGNTNNTRYFGPDTTITGVYLASWILKYDTLGNFKWIRSQGTSNITSLAALGNPNSKLLMQDTLLHYIKSVYNTGAQLGMGVTSQRGIYDFTYTRQGNLLNIQRLPLTDTMLHLSTYNASFLDEQSGWLYIPVFRMNDYAGAGVAVFDANRNLVSYDTCTTTGTAFIPQRISGFRAGNAQYYFGYLFGTNYTFKGQTFANPFSGPGGFSFIMKLDLNNNLVWKKQINSTVPSDVGINFCNFDPGSGRLGLTGIGKNVVIGSDTLIIPGPVAKTPLLILDTSGNLLQKNYYSTNNAIGGLQGGTWLTLHNNDAFVGGMVIDSVYAGTMSYTSVGGPCDFFVAKYGYSCNCTTPVAAFTHTTPTAQRSVQFTYTGTPAIVDSVAWIFGDGARATGNSVSHTYTQPGNYTICSIAYTSCGTDSSCQQITIPVRNGIGAVPGSPGAAIYPNPVHDMLTVERAGAGSTIIIYDVVGRPLLHFIASGSKDALDLQLLSPGIYTIAIRTTNGQSRMQSFVKQ